MKRLLLLLALILPAVRAQTNAPPRRALAALAPLPVLHDGRVMPLDTFARLHLLQFSGRKTAGDKTALHWMAEVLFAPRLTLGDRVFVINHPEVLDDIGVERTEAIPGKRKPSTRHFSYNHLRPGMEKLDALARQSAAMEESERGLVEKEALRVYGNIMAYRMLNHVFNYARPSPGLRIESPELRQKLGLAANAQLFSYLELKPFAGVLAKEIEAAQAAGSIESWTPSQQEAFVLASRMFAERNQHRDLPFHVLPAAPHGTAEWLSPWEALHDENGDSALINAAADYAAVASAWVIGDVAKLREAADKVETFAVTRMQKQTRDVRFVRSETRFNRLAPFSRAKVFYVIAFLVSLGAMVSGHAKIRLAAWISLVPAITLHVAGIVWRVVLTGRPPVTNLYGTFLFVGLICLILALLAEATHKNGLGLFAGTFVALTFLFVADRFGAEGDTLHKVVAVLASNFWLSTHVLAVTTGYAGVWIAGVFGHIYLVMRLFGAAPKRLKEVTGILDGLLGFGLTFAFLGTMLGGVWADQSWGRFWGWDPKENGALLIVLWTAVLYHARVGGMIRDVGLAAGSVIGCIMVMLAWLGVNLLGVGLHSYGFTNSLAVGFYSYIAFELAFLAAVFLIPARPPQTA